jgi:hypothetical protein
VAALLACTTALADFELTAPDGRRVLLKDDGTWRYVEGAGKAATDAKAGDAKAETAGGKPQPAEKKQEKKLGGEALLSLVGKVDGPRICRLQLRLVNNLPYEIRSLVPELSIYRANGVAYDSLFAGFSFLKPGDSQRREVRFNGIDCKDIARVLVGGGDRCEMGDLDKFTPGRGMCLARVRVVASDVLPFEKKPPEEPETKPEAKDAGADAKDPKAPADGASPAPPPAR